MGTWLLALAWLCVAQPPDYDALSDRYGNVLTERHHAALIALARDPEQLDAVYSEAAKGSARAVNIWAELERQLAQAGTGVADRVTSPECQVMVYRELAGTCIPDWTFLDFLNRGRPGADRLRETLSRAFATRARERGLQNQVLISAVNALVGVGVAAAVLREAGIAARAGIPEVPPAAGAPGPMKVAPPGAPSPSSPGAAKGGSRATTGFIDDVTATSHGKGVGRGTVDVRATVEAIQSGKLSPRDIFRNDQGLLPRRSPGYYQEFVHPTPGVSGVGPQRIIRGQGGELYYTPDHYKTFIPLN